MAETLVISPRNLGFLDTEKGCPRCFWWMMRMKRKFPFVPQHMPAIMYAADATQKVVFEGLVNKGKLPKEFSPFTNITSLINFGTYRDFGAMHPKGVKLRGEPDVLAECSDNSLCILDHKTAFYKGNDDPFMPQYQCQTIGYCWIAEEIYKKAANRAALIYWQFNKEEILEDPLSYYSDKGLNAKFTPQVHEFDVDFRLLDRLIDDCLKIVKSTIPPEGFDKCKDCAALERLFEVGEQLRMQDTALRQQFGHDPFVASVLFERKNHQMKALNSGSHLLLEDVSFEQDGVIANWDLWDRD